MATENKKSTLELKAELVRKIEDAVTAANGGNWSELPKAVKDEIKDATKAYNASATADAYAAWAALAAEDNPYITVKTMAATGYIPGLLKANIRRSTKTGLWTGKCDEAKVKASPIDLKLMHGCTFFHDDKWFHKCQKFAYVYALGQNKALGGNKDFDYQIDAAAKLFEFAPDADPASKKSRVKALQVCVDAIYFAGDGELSDIKIDSRDLEYIDKCMTAAGKERGDVALRDPSGMVEYIFDVVGLHVVSLETGEPVQYRIIVV